jgi:hypothetical protein
MLFATIFYPYRGGQFYMSRKLKYPEKNENISIVTNKLYQAKLYRILHLATSESRANN